MAITITQQPTDVALTQSPVIVTVFENTDVITSASFQYVLELDYWVGNETPTTYTLEKYPNQSGRGIFDVGRILNATFQQPVQENKSQAINFNSTIYGRYQSGSAFITGSSVTTSGSVGLDGYQFFNESINTDVYGNTSRYPYFPILTDGPATQSFQLNDYGNLEIFSPATPSVARNSFDNIKYESNLGTYYVSVNKATSSLDYVQYVPIGQNALNFPTELNNSNLEWFAVSPANGTSSTSDSIRFEVKCPTKYENIRIKWKNRWGAFDYFNFDLVSRQSFQTQTEQYQPQIGTWGGTSLTYNYYDTSKQNYATDSIQTISVNSDYVSEQYNEIFKQLLVSDEIYFIDYTEAEISSGFPYLRPLTIKSSSVQFKTQAVDKLIQYQFDFQYGQGYKLQF